MTTRVKLIMVTCLLELTVRRNLLFLSQCRIVYLKPQYSFNKDVKSCKFSLGFQEHLGRVLRKEIGTMIFCAEVFVMNKRLMKKLNLYHPFWLQLVFALFGHYFSSFLYNMFG